MKPDSLKKVLVIGTQHLDVAWLWKRVPHGEELMKMVFELAIHLVERNPGARFVMSRSTPWGFEIVEKKYPHLFAQVQKAVADGSIELCGGQWVEPDNLIPSGESHLRQCLYGQLYYLSRFGKMASVVWSPDVFGHGNTLPQLFSTCGLDGYYFHRALPEDEAGKPIQQFVWEGPDGSQVLCFAGNWNERPDEAAFGELFEAATHGLPVDFVVAGRRSDRRMTIEEEWLDLPGQMQKRYGLDECRWAAADDMLAEMKTYRDALPVITGDLGGYTLTGTYTSDQLTKRFNRKLENDLATAEFVNTAALVQGHTYYSGILSGAWRDLCLNQFHDIACGTSYRAVQEEAHGLYYTIQTRADEALRMAHDDLAGDITTNTREGAPIVVYNSLSCPRTDPIAIDVPGRSPVRIVSSDGDAIPSQPVSDAGGSQVVFTPKPIPPCGHDVYFVQQARSTEIIHDPELVLENEYVRVEFDVSYGSMSSLFDKRLGLEFVKDGTRANRIITYEDKNDYSASPDHRWDPWLIRYTGATIDPHGAYTVYVKESGPVRKVICVERSMSVGPDAPDTVINQEISLYADSPLINIRMYGDWLSEQACVKAEFDLAFQATTVACHMPYGVIERPSVYPTTKVVGAEAMEDRVKSGSERDEPDRPMQMWLDFSDGEKGLAFLNNGKYGYDSTEEQVRLTLMRAPFIRDGEVAGLGPFEFSYALLPHAGTWREAGLPELGYSFNRPLVACPSWSHAGSIAPHSSLFSLSDQSVMITAAKKAERSNAVVLRLYESRGVGKELTLSSRRSVRRATEANGLEMAAESDGVTKATAHDIRVSMRAFEVKTVLLEFED